MLEGYLKAWYPILATTQGRIVFIDGFAGPGEYTGGEPGSPIIALRTLKAHYAKARFSAQVKFLFVEDREDRFHHLQALVSAEKEGLPSTCDTKVVHGKFDDTMTGLLNSLRRQQQQLAPCFLMVDPFGVSDTPMSTIRGVLEHPKSEVYISFMYESINRFKSTSEFAKHLDVLFGCTDWRHGLTIHDPRTKAAFYFDLYREQLRRAGATYVLHFELYRGNELVYAIFFGTKHPLGCDRMKQAIWKVAPFGDFAFRGTRSEQLALGLEPETAKAFAEELVTLLQEHAWTTYEDTLAVAQSDRTDYHSGHLKKALAYLESTGRLDVDSNTRRRSGSFPAGCRFRIRS